MRIDRSSWVSSSSRLKYAGSVSRSVPCVESNSTKASDTSSRCPFRIIEIVGGGGIDILG